jgi:hypothetical protein
MLDDVAIALPGANPSAEGRMAAIVHGLVSPIATQRAPLHAHD